MEFTDVVIHLPWIMGMGVALPSLNFPPTDEPFLFGHIIVFFILIIRNSCLWIMDFGTNPMVPMTLYTLDISLYSLEGY